MHEIYFAHDEQESPVSRTGQLVMAGYRVTLFRSGDELCEALEKHKPDLVALDVLLRGAHGFEICRRIRKRYTRDELPVILMSDIYRARLPRRSAARRSAGLSAAPDPPRGPVAPGRDVDRRPGRADAGVTPAAAERAFRRSVRVLRAF